MAVEPLVSKDEMRAAGIISEEGDMPGDFSDRLEENLLQQGYEKAEEVRGAMDALLNNGKPIEEEFDMENISNKSLFKKLLNAIPELKTKRPRTLEAYYRTIEFHGEAYLEKIIAAYPKLKMVDESFSDPVFEYILKIEDSLSFYDFGDINFFDALLQINEEDVKYVSDILREILHNTTRSGNFSLSDFVYLFATIAKHKNELEKLVESMIIDDVIFEKMVEASKNTAPTEFYKRLLIFVNKTKNKNFSSLNEDRKSTRLNSSHTDISRMPSSA